MTGLTGIRQLHKFRSLYCLISRLVLVNAAKTENEIHQLLNLRTKNRELFYQSPIAINRLSSLFDVSVDDFMRWVSLECWLPAQFEELKLSRHANQALRFCPRCIENGDHFAYHQHSCSSVCFIHGEKLVSKCPHCRSKIPGNDLAKIIALPFACVCGHQLCTAEKILGASDAIPYEVQIDMKAHFDWSADHCHLLWPLDRDRRNPFKSGPVNQLITVSRELVKASTSAPNFTHRLLNEAIPHAQDRWLFIRKNSVRRLGPIVQLPETVGLMNSRLLNDWVAGLCNAVAPMALHQFFDDPQKSKTYYELNGIRWILRQAQQDSAETTIDLLYRLYDFSQRPARPLFAPECVLTWLSIPTYLEIYKAVLSYAIALAIKFDVASVIERLKDAFYLLADSTLVQTNSRQSPKPVMICVPNWVKIRQQTVPLVVQVFEKCDLATIGGNGRFPEEQFFAWRSEWKAAFN